MIDISIVVPLYNEEESLRELGAWIDRVVSSMGRSYEVIYVDDGSKDGTVAEVKKLAKNDERVKMVSFSRNFGKEAAIFAGFQKAKAIM